MRNFQELDFLAVQLGTEVQQLHRSTGLGESSCLCRGLYMFSTSPDLSSVHVWCLHMFNTLPDVSSIHGVCLCMFSTLTDLPGIHAVCLCMLEQGTQECKLPLNMYLVPPTPPPPPPPPPPNRLVCTLLAWPDLIPHRGNGMWSDHTTPVAYGLTSYLNERKRLDNASPLEYMYSTHTRQDQTNGYICM